MNASEAVRLIDRATLPSAVQGRQAGRMRTAAGALSRRTLFAAKAALLMRRLHEFTALLYERDAAGEPVNVDALDGRILIPAPWGRAGYAQWGLVPSERDILRSIVRGRRDRLFWYDALSRAWHVNVDRYPTAAAAHEAIERDAITPEAWHAAYAAWRRRQ
ncbi:MAG: hypothetical protein QM346_08915 [Chloroflexota bacterium]|jgi:hypothetical protein|nr:hypothetical protein [Chloroflexota bacterium]